jgi:hypothetical protein
MPEIAGQNSVSIYGEGQKLAYFIYQYKADILSPFKLDHNTSLFSNPGRALIFCYDPMITARDSLLNFCFYLR